MNRAFTLIAVPLGVMMYLCYKLTGNYAAAIVIFTLLTKIILLPVSIWVQKNGIKIVRMQPNLNKIKRDYFGDKERIADETSFLYKKEKYNPFANLIPMFVQLALLVGLVRVIYNPLTHLVRMNGSIIELLISYTGKITDVDTASNSIQLNVVEIIKNASNPDSFLAIPGMTQGLLDAVREIDLNLFGLNLAQVPYQTGGTALVIPLFAGLAALALSLIQNKLNPLQADQSKFNQLGTMTFSVGISLFLGAFVPIGVGFYWICSNLFTILQQLVLNIIINPKKFIDYEALNVSRKELEDMENYGASNKKLSGGFNAKREKQDYKKFFSIANKHLVFYSEKSGFYKYYEHIINELLTRSNVIIHYVTSDPDDIVFELAKEQQRLKPYYIGERKLITLFMKMDADMVIMTMPDLGNYYIKRSYIRKDIEYVYVFHYPLSTHMVLHADSLNHYDTILCVGEFQFDEIRRTEEIYGLREKKLIACGYGLLEKLFEGYCSTSHTVEEGKKLLIAPSWQKDNILDSCIDDLLSVLLGKGFKVIVRPHPEYVKRYGAKMDAIIKKHADHQGRDLVFELDFSENSSIFNSDTVITDWSGTAYEFSFVTCKPAVFIDTPKKINNPEYARLGIEPLEISLRSRIGVSVSPDDLTALDQKIVRLLERSNEYSEEILNLRNTYIANFGKSGQVACRYILDSLKNNIAKRKIEKGENENEKNRQNY
jgi:YidC/Oxa1 family membrane protein insertase